MARSSKSRRLLLSVALIFLLAPFSTAVPCFSVPRLRWLASLLSASVETVPFFLYVLVIAYYEKKKGNPRWLSTILEAVFLNLVVLILKYAFNRPRPLPLHTPGYPSGHTARAFWLALKAFELSKGLGTLLFAYAVLVAWSRVELCVHYPLDVVGGAIVAFLVREVWREYVEPRLGLWRPRGDLNPGPPAFPTPHRIGGRRSVLAELRGQPP